MSTPRRLASLWARHLNAANRSRSNKQLWRRRQFLIEVLEDRRVLANWSGDIPNGTIWSNTEVQRIVGTVRVPTGSTLTIQPGTIVKTNAFAGFSIDVEGTLIADGTPTQPIVFTSLRDDTGMDGILNTGDDQDTNVDGPSNGNNGDWNRIEFKTGSTNSLLDNVQVRFAGLNSLGAIVVNQAELTLTNSVLRNSSTAGVRIQASSPTLANNTFSNNTGAAASMDLASNPAIGGVSVSGNAINGLQVDAGTLVGNGFWNDPDIVYWLSNDTTVPANSKLTIGAGQIVKFSFFDVDLIVNGTLDARGTVVQPITFTEARDDAAGGDTNGNGSSSAPGASNWRSIEFTPSSTGNVMDHVIARYGGSSGLGQIVVTKSELTLTNSTISNSGVDGVRIVGSNPTLANNTYSNNQSAAVSMDLASNPKISGVIASGNSIDGLQVDAGTLVGNGFWNDPEIVYWLDNDITVPAGSTLTVNAGQVVKFGFFAADLIVNGTLDARGTAAQPILFTEARDDTGIDGVLGTSDDNDTNGNGSNSLPTPGQWRTIEFTDSSTNCVLDHVIARYGGSASGTGSILINNSEPTIRNSTISSSGVDGIRMVGSTPTLTGNTFSKNIGAAVSKDLASDVTILDSTLIRNGVNGLAVEGGTLSADLIWDDSDVVYWLTGAVTVPVGRTLTITPGQIIKGAFLNSGLLIDGVLRALGTTDQPIIITSRDDDTAGGDTNNNGPVSIGLEDWAGIEIRAGSIGSTLDHLDLRYTDGPGAAGAVRVVNGQATLSNSTIRNAAGFGVAARTTGDVIVTNVQFTAYGDSAILAESGGKITAINNTIDGGARGVFVRTGSSVTLTNNLITNNSGAGVLAENLATVIATFNDVFNPSRSNYIGVTDPTGTNGNLSVDPKYFNRANRQFQLTSGSPIIDAGTSNNTPPTDMLGNNRFDDPNVVNRGAGSSPFVDLGAFERQEISTSNVDLIAFNVTGPTTASQGQVVSVNWKVRNVGTGPAIASWSDAIYLSSEPTFTPSARFLGRVTHNTDLGSADTYSASANVTLSNVQPGRNYFIVRTNDLDQVFEGISTANNGAAASSSLDFAVTQLIVGTPLNDVFSLAGQNKYYQVNVPPGQSLNVFLDSNATTGALELYVRKDSLPSRSEFDFRSSSAVQPDQSLVVPTTGAGTYFILAYANSGSAATSPFKLAASIGDFDLAGVTPSSGANSGRVTIAVRGTGFTRNSLISLIAPDGVSKVDAVATQFDDATRIYATFDLSSRAVGVYDVRADDGVVNDTIVKAFAVTAGAAGHLTARIVSPDRIRTGFAGSISVEYKNDGDADLVAPILILNAKNAKLRLPSQTDFRGTSIEFLAINSQGPAGVLPPGATGSAKILFLPIDATNVDFELNQLETGKVFDWNAEKSELRPPDVPIEAWNAIYANFVAAVGNTSGEYQAALARDATYLSQLGEYVSDTARLYSFELARAGNFGEITQRYTLGAFGRGVPDSTINTVTTESDGTITIRSAGLSRQFFLQRDGSYRGIQGDTGILSRVSGEVRLREPVGTMLFFQTDGLLAFIEDTNGNRINYGYTNGKLTSLTDSFGDQTTYTYDAAGLVSQITDSVGRVTSFIYDASGHITAITDPDGTTQFSYVTGQGAAREHATSRIDFQDGTRQSFEYDSQGRLIHTFANAGEDNITLSYGIPAGVTLTTAAGVTTTLNNDSGQPGIVVDEKGQTTRFYYDSNHRVDRVIGPDGIASELKYDANGNPTMAQNGLGQPLSLVYEQTRNRLVSLRNARGQTTQFASDASGNITSLTHADGSTEQFGYDVHGMLTKIKDSLGQSSQFTYNSKGLVSSKQLADGSKATFTYDAHRNVTSVTDASGVTSMQYDAADRLTKITYPGSRSLTFTYDTANRRTSSTDQVGFKVNYFYDALGRISELTNTNGARIVSYGYDSLSRLIREDRGNATRTDYTYFEDGSTQSIIHRAANNSLQSSFEYTYDSNRHVSSVQTLEGKTTYAYDAAGRLTTISLTGGRIITYQYDATGNRSSVTDSGVVTNYSPNLLDQYTTVGTTNFSYDLAGNLISKSNASGTTTYAYDAQGRLVSIQTPTESLSYEYDALGHLRANTRNGVRREYLIDPLGLGDVVGEYTAEGQLIANYSHGFGLADRVDATGAASYYTFDITGNTDHVLDSVGQVVNSYAYLPFGESLGATGATANPFTFGGRFGVMNATDGLYFMRQRFYDSSAGRFVSADPIGLAGGDVNQYAYVKSNPVGFADPSGLVIKETLEIAAKVGQRILTVFVDKLGFASTFASAPFGRFTDIVANTIGDVQGVVVVGILIGRDINGSLSNADLKSQFIAGSGTAATGWAIIQGTTAAEIIAGGASTLSGVIVYAGGSLLVGGAVLIAATGGYIAGRWLDKNVPIIHKIAERTTGAVVDLFLPPERIKLGDRAKIIQKFCGDLLEEQSDECHRRLAEAGIAQVNPRDPNDIGGPVGFGPQRFVAPDITFPYTILFENKPDATAAAVQVRITHQLDSNLDWNSFEVGDFGFGDLQVEVPAGRRFYSTRVDYKTQRGEYVDVNVGIDLGTGIVSWTFTSIDPKTSDAATDIDAGFLPPNIKKPEGDGFVNFKIRAKQNLVTGTKISAIASIVFDTNASLDTPLFVNTIDAGTPSSAVSMLPVQSPSTIPVRWSGNDDAGGSGISQFDIYVSVNASAPVLWLTAVTAQQANYTGEFGKTYSFYSIAIDGVGFREAPPNTPDATTTVASLIPWQNPLNPLDVDDSGATNPLDVLVLINDLNLSGSRKLSAGQNPTDPRKYLDVDGDGFVAPLDVLVIINFINQRGNAEGEWTHDPLPISRLDRESTDALLSDNSWLDDLVSKRSRKFF